jgi:hypothetical protein
VQFDRIEAAKEAFEARIGLVPTMASIQDAHHLGNIHAVAAECVGIWQ